MPTSAQHWIRPTPLHRVTLAFSCAIVILIVVGALSYRSLVVSSETDRWVGHTHEVLANLDELNLGVADLEATSRGFVLTGFDADAAAVRASAAGAEAHEAAVRVLTRDNPRQQQRLPSLERLLAQNVQWAQSLVALRRTRGIDAAVAAARGGDGHRLGAAISAVTEQMRGEELRLLGLREGEARRISDQAKWVVALAALLGLLITVAAAWSVRRDALRRTAAEAALRDSEDRYGALIEGVRDYAIVMLDPVGKIISWNRGAERMTGSPAEQVLGQNFASFFPQDEDRAAAILRSTAAGGAHEDEGVRVREDGTRFAVHTTYAAIRGRAGALLGFSAVSRDLSRATESEARYRGLLEAAPDAMVVMNQAGEIVLLNLQAEKQFGYSRDELIGQKVTSLIPEGFA
ncbi:MAG TPA: PAS domain S-box protein, partial [Caulobacteraceae bacterium]|nr:PAS domain S-box protein [Caulobacteraceae bacterium]